MQLKFFGGASEVGRSAILMKDDRSLLFDFGVKIDHKIDYPVGIPTVDAVVLSHAHLDHSGFMPGVYTEESVPTFGTMPTLRLANLLLDDSLNIAKKEHLVSRFKKRQLTEFVNKYNPLKYHQRVSFGNFDIEFSDAGHICGSAITMVERAKGRRLKRIVYTGDFKLDEQMLHNGAEIVAGDVLIIESTYADRDHQDREQTVSNFVNRVQTVLDNGGNALVPAFAVGRSQELLSILYENGMAASTYIDGMAKEATSIVMNFPEFISKPDVLAKAVREANWVRDKKDRDEALNGPSVILTTSGMLHGGPVLDYITRLGRNSQILLTGFQQEGTNGRMLLDRGQIVLHGKPRKVPEPVSFYDFSAHAGRRDLYEYVRRSAPQVVVCVHGDQGNAKNFADTLRMEGFEAYAPVVGDTINLED